MIVKDVAPRMSKAIVKGIVRRINNSGVNTIEIMAVKEVVLLTLHLE